MNNKKIAAFLTAVSVLGGAYLPVCAEESSEPVYMEIAYDDGAYDVQAEAAGEDDNITEADNTAAETEDDTDNTAAAEEVPADAPAETSAVNENSSVIAVYENDTEDDTDDAVSYAYAQDETYNPETGLISDEAIYLASAWAEWDMLTGTLTLKGQLPDTYWDSKGSKAYTISRLAGIYEEAVKKVVITEGTKAGASAAQMFRGMENLTEIQGLSNLDTSSVTKMTGMFISCKSLKTLDLSSFETGSVTEMNGMFNNCIALTSVDMTGADTSKVTNMNNMFKKCTSLKTIAVSSKWSTAAVTSSTDMFGECSVLTGGAGTPFDGDHTDKAYACVDGGLSKPGYLTDPSAVVAAPAKPTVAVKTAFGGKTVQFSCDDEVYIYYNIGSSNITTSCKCIKAGDTVFFDQPMTGSSACIYFKAYNGRWSALGKWGVLNVQLAAPQIKPAVEENQFKVYTQAKNSYIVYTLDGSTPKIKEGAQKLEVENGRLVWDTQTTVTVKKGQTIKAVAIRNGLVTSDVMTFKNENE